MSLGQKFYLMPKILRNDGFKNFRILEDKKESISNYKKVDIL